MRFCGHDHYHQVLPLISALQEAGHEMVDTSPLDLFLIDLDPDKIYGYRQLIDWAADLGAVILQYPHGAPASTLCYDSLYEPYKRVSGQLTFAEGEAELLRLLGVERPTRSLGWTLCPQLPFLPVASPKKVLFGPTHPNGSGSQLPERLEMNRKVFQTLLDGPWELTVRYLGKLEDNGLWEAEGVRFTEGLLDNSTVEIDAADVVVAGEGTFPTLAIARGTPTIVYGQFMGAMYGFPDEEPTPLRKRHLYEDWVRYPLDFDDGPLDELIYAACKERDDIATWRQRWVGNSFNPQTFPTLIEEFVAELSNTKLLATT